MSFHKKRVVSEFLETHGFLSLFVFSRIYFSVLLQIWREINLRPTSPVKALHFAHTQTRDIPNLTPRHYTPPSHPTTHYLLITAPTSRTLLLHSPTHNHTLLTELNKFLFSCVPQIFLLEYIDTAYAEMVIWTVNPQPWRCTNNSLGLPHAQSFSVCLSP